MTTNLKDKRVLPFGGSFAIQDQEIIDFIQTVDYRNCLWNDTINRDFCSVYRNWIMTTTKNKVSSLDSFPYALYSNGTSESFEMFYIKNKDRRFRCFKGEYIYHQLAWRNNWQDWIFIEDEALNANDAVVVSLPFSDTGNKHDGMDLLLTQCEELNIPVLIDCAYFGVCSDINFDFSSKCITDITFSLSKQFPVAHARVGIRFTKVDDDDLMFVYDKINYNNRLGANLGLELLENFSPDYICNKYKSKQSLCCNLLDVAPSKTVLFGIDSNSRFNEYNRGSATNRLGFYKWYTKSDQEIKEFLNASTNK